MPQLLLLGLDAADWKLLAEKIAQGKMPHFQKLMKEGASGPLRSLSPPFSPALWATIATGKRPYEHGIVGFTYPNKATGKVEPYNSTSLRSPALWHILSHQKKRTNVIGWWNTAPAEIINGVMVDETFRLTQNATPEEWGAARESVSPSTFLEQLSTKRVHPQKLPESLLKRLVPKLYEINCQEDLRVAAIAKVLAEDITTLEVTLHLLRETTWDFTTLCLMGLDTLAHQGMNYRAPFLAALTPHDAEFYGELVDRAYELYDEWVGLLVAAAGKEATIMIVSDHGFYSDHRRVYSLKVEPTAPCSNHSPVGTLILHGPSIQQGVSIPHATLLDLCPTILSFFGISPGRDMPGKVLAKAFCGSWEKKRIASWDWLKKTRGTFSSSPSPEAVQAALRQLTALGYLPGLPLNNEEVFQQACCDQLLHKALAYLHAEEVSTALDLLEEACQQAQQAHLPCADLLQELAFLYWKVDRERAAAANFLQLVRVRRRDARHAAQQLLLKKDQLIPGIEVSYEEAWKLRELIARAPLDEETMIFFTALAKIIAPNRRKPHWQEILKSHATTLFHLAEKNPLDDFKNLYAGKVALILNEIPLGFHFLQRAAQERPEEIAPWTLMAQYYNTIHSFAEAEQIVRKALEQDPFSSAGWLILARSLFHQHRLEEAYQAALQARKSELHKSEFFELLAAMALQKNPSSRRPSRYQGIAVKARKRLEIAISRHCHSSTLSAFQQNISLPEAKNNSEQQTGNSKEYIIITGLPRSGTSLVMQMLAAGGFSVMTDGKRLADRSNPRGYFEHEKIKTIEKNLSILQKGVATKVVIPLLWELPKTLPVKLIFIQRDLAEVITSQHRMAGKMGSHQQLEEVYRHYLKKTEEFLTRCSWPVLRLSYASIITHPEKSAHAINAFLGGSFLESAMAAVVDPALYHSRGGLK